MSSPPSQASVPTVSGEKGCGESSGKPQPSDTLGIHVGSMDLPQRGRVAVHAPMVGGWRGTHGTRRPGAPSRQAAGPAPFYMLGEMGIPFLLIKKKQKTIYFCLCWVFTATLGLSSVAASRGFFPLQCAGLLIAVASLVENCKHHRNPKKQQKLRWLLLWSTGSGAQPQEFLGRGSVAPWHVGSSWTRDGTRVPPYSQADS